MVTPRKPGHALVEKLQRSGLRNLEPAEVRTIREHASTWVARDRARICEAHGVRVAERVIDDAWEALDAEPTAEEYDEIAVLLEEAAAHAREQATSAREAQTKKEPPTP